MISILLLYLTFMIKGVFSIINSYVMSEIQVDSSQSQMFNTNNWFISDRAFAVQYSTKGSTEYIEFVKPSDSRIIYKSKVVIEEKEKIIHFGSTSQGLFTLIFIEEGKMKFQSFKMINGMQELGFYSKFDISDEISTDYAFNCFKSVHKPKTSSVYVFCMEAQQKILRVFSIEFLTEKVKFKDIDVSDDAAEISNYPYNMVEVLSKNQSESYLKVIAYPKYDKNGESTPFFAFRYLAIKTDEAEEISITTKIVKPKVDPNRKFAGFYSLQSKEISPELEEKLQQMADEDPQDSLYLALFQTTDSVLAQVMLIDHSSPLHPDTVMLEQLDLELAPQQCIFSSKANSLHFINLKKNTISHVQISYIFRAHLSKDTTKDKFPVALQGKFEKLYPTKDDLAIFGTFIETNTGLSKGIYLPLNSGWSVSNWHTFDDEECLFSEPESQQHFSNSLLKLNIIKGELVLVASIIPKLKMLTPYMNEQFPTFQVKDIDSSSWWQTYAKLNPKTVKNYGRVNSDPINQFIFSTKLNLYSSEFAHAIFGNIYEYTLKLQGKCNLKYKHLRGEKNVKLKHTEFKMTNLDFLFEGLYVVIKEEEGTFSMCFFIQPHVEFNLNSSMLVSLEKRTKYKLGKLLNKPKIRDSIRLKDDEKNINGNIIMVEIQKEGQLFSEIVLFFAGEINQLIGVQKYDVKNIIIPNLSVERSQLNQIDLLDEFIGTAGKSTPFLALCDKVSSCYFLVVDLFEENSSESSNILQFNSDYPGIKQPFCPKWIKGSSLNEHKYIFLYSYCSNGEFSLYRKRLADSSFEEVPLPPDLTSVQANQLSLDFDNHISILSTEDKAWIVRNQEFSLPENLDVYKLILSDVYKEGAKIKSIKFDISGHIIVSFWNDELKQQILLNLQSSENKPSIKAPPNHFFSILNTVELYYVSEPGTVCKLIRTSLLLNGNPIGSGLTYILYCKEEEKEELTMEVVNGQKEIMIFIDPVNSEASNGSSEICEFKLTYNFGNYSESTQYNIIYSPQGKITEPVLKPIKNKLIFKKGTINLNELFEYGDHMVRIKTVGMNSHTKKLTDQANFPVINTPFLRVKESKDSIN